MRTSLPTGKEETDLQARTDGNGDGDGDGDDNGDSDRNVWREKSIRGSTRQSNIDY